MKENGFHWHGVMKASTQSLPLGNGDFGANVWAEKDCLHLLLSKTDSWSELHRLLKLGHICIRMTPNPWENGADFDLSYERGTLTIDTGAFCARLWIDAYHPLFMVELESSAEFEAKVSIDNYRDKPLHIVEGDFSNYHMNTRDEAVPLAYDNVEAADTVFAECGRIGQYHRNETSCYEFTLKHQGLGDFPEKNDPFLHRTFGYAVQGEGLVTDGERLVSSKKTRLLRLTIAAYTAQCESAEVWKQQLFSLFDAKPDYEKHCAYWESIWKDRYVEISGDAESEQLMRGYNAQRYLHFCAGKGAYPLKFNGSIFYCHPSPFVKDGVNYDYLAWGGPYWFQNTRLTYWGMLFSGDYELMMPFFDLYIDALPLAKYKTKEYFGHDGAIYPETITIFGTYENHSYGSDRRNRHKSYIPNRYVRYYHVGSLEMCCLMLRYYEFSKDEAFLRGKALPFIREILRFYQSHYDCIDGSLQLYPSSSLETWQDCANDTPTIAALRFVSENVLRYGAPESDIEDIARYFLGCLPKLPVGEKNGKTVLLPCEVLVDPVRRNFENPELYPVFPYIQFGLHKPDLELARETYAQRDIKTSCCWHQHGVQAAILGLKDEAMKEALANSGAPNEDCIFPAFWGPNNDWTPDEDNGGMLMMTVDAMLVQSDADTIDILPTWDEKKDVHFRLPVSGGNFVEVLYRNGKIERLQFDSAPKQQVFVHAPQLGTK